MTDTTTIDSGSPVRAGAAAAPAEAQHHPALRGTHGHDAARIARPDHLQHRAADDRRRAQRRRPHAVGHHRLHPRLDDHAAGLRQARRPDRPQGPVHRRDRALHRRLRRRRPRARHDLAHRRPRHPGPRRRRAHDPVAGDHRRRRPRPRARYATWASWAASSPCRPSPARCSAAGSPKASAGAGRSG